MNRSLFGHVRDVSILLAAILLVSAFGRKDAFGATLNFAGLVVRHADGELAFAYVGFPEAEINGVELLKRSGFDVVTVSFGGLGEGVCSIDDHGCPATDCRKRVCQGTRDVDPFWQYFRQAAPGDWTAMALGGSQTKVRDGDIDGWSWTPKDAGLPSLTLADVATRAGYDGTAFTGVAAGEPGAVLRREGFSPGGDESQNPAIYAGGVGLVAIAFVAVGVVVYRRRNERVEP